MSSIASPELRFQASDHTYWVGTEKLPGVTTVLGVLGGYEGIPPRVLKIAADRGTAVHAVTELDDDGTLDYGSLDDELTGYLMGWHKFKREMKPTILDAEIADYSRKLRYAGTRDRRLAIGRKVGILDIKSSFMLMPTTGPQTAAYEKIWNETAGKDDQTKHRWGLRLTRNGDYELKEYKDPGDWNTFLSCLNVWRFIERHNPTKKANIEELQYEWMR